MQTADKTYLINSLRAISETLDGETIIIDLENGNYYSMNETGSLIWEYIKFGYTVNQIIQQLSSQYEASKEVVEQSLMPLLRMLENNTLIKIAEKQEVAPVAILEGSKKPFLPPAIDKYEDMQEMLLADPVHDVDEAGWPKLKEEK